MSLMAFATGALNRAAEIRDERKAERMLYVQDRYEMIKKADERRRAKNEEIAKAREQAKAAVAMVGDTGLDEDTATALLANGTYDFKSLINDFRNKGAKVTRGGPDSKPSIVVPPPEPNKVTTVDTQTESLFPGAKPAGRFESILFGERPEIGVDAAAKARAAELGLSEDMPATPTIPEGVRIEMAKAIPEFLKNVDPTDIKTSELKNYAAAMREGRYEDILPMLRDKAAEELNQAVKIAEVRAANKDTTPSNPVEAQISLLWSDYNAADKAGDVERRMKIRQQIEKLSTDYMNRSQSSGNSLLPAPSQIAANPGMATNPQAAQAPSPAAKPTLEQWLAAAKKVPQNANFSDEQLIAEYNRKYGN